MVLIAENDDIVAELIALLVEQAGATPLVTYDGEQALTLARERRPALLITESLLPGLDGAGLIAALGRERGIKLPSILVTSAPKAQAAASGATAVLTKPFHIARLEVLLARFLHQGTVINRAVSAASCANGVGRPPVIGLHDSGVGYP
jgi:CheY-like chemotaxis protein